MANWPNEDEFLGYLVASGLTAFAQSEAQAELDLDGALDAAVERWNDLTHYWPFLSNGNTSETRHFEQPGSYLLDFNGGLLSITSLASDRDYLGTDSYTTGTERVNIRDYRLKPTDAPNQGKPWTYMELGWCGGRGIVSVTGEWGFCRQANLPSSARRAVMALAAQELAPQIAASLSRGGLKRLTRGDETKEFAALGDATVQWQGAIDLALKQGFVRPRIA